MKIRGFIVLTLFAATLLSCRKDCIEGSGTIITEYFDATGFTAINTEGPFDIVIDTGYYEISVEADRAFMPYIKFSQSGNTLNIYVSSNRCLDGIRPYIHIFAPDIGNITQQGSGDIDCYDLYNNSITVNHEGSGDISLFNIDTYDAEVNLSGSGTVLLEGIGKSAVYTLSGSGYIKGLNFSVEYGEVYVPGSGEVYIDAYKDLYINISGSGTVFYRPTQLLEYHIPGSGDVIQINN